MASVARSPARAAFALALFLPAHALAGETDTIVDRMQQLKTARQIPAQAAAASFRCPPSSAAGVCRGRLPDGAYPKDVSIFYTSWPPPKNARRILYLHGHLQSYDTLLAFFNFKELLAKSESKDTISIVPDGTGPGFRNETYAAEWRSAMDAPQRFRRFMAGVEAVLAGSDAAPAAEPELVLAGHSGAGSILDRLIACGGGGVCWPSVREVYLFDAAYGPADFDVYAEFARAPGNRFLSVYQDTVGRNEELWRKINRASGAARIQPLSGKVDRETVRAQTTAFVDANAEKVNHMATVGKYFPAFLAPR